MEDLVLMLDADQEFFLHWPIGICHLKYVLPRVDLFYLFPSAYHLMLQPSIRVFSFLSFCLFALGGGLSSPSFHSVPIIFPSSRSSPRAIQSRCGKAHVSSPLDKILFNDWYIFKPATSNAVITVIIHTPCKDSTQEPHQYIQLYKCTTSFQYPMINSSAYLQVALFFTRPILPRRYLWPSSPKFLLHRRRPSG